MINYMELSDSSLLDLSSGTAMELNDGTKHEDCDFFGYIEYRTIFAYQGKNVLEMAYPPTSSFVTIDCEIDD